jgi:hypothetical protein
VLHGSGCPADNDLIVEGPGDRSAADNVDYPKGHDWDLRVYEPGAVMHRSFGGQRAERFVKSQLPWSVRFRMDYDSESGMMALYGTHADVCMASRVVAHYR